MDSHLQRSSTASRRATWFVSGLLLLVLLAAGVLAHFMLQTTRERLFTDLERSLTLPIQNRSAVLVAWQSSMQTETERLTQSDMIRLLASEVHDLGENGLRTLLAMALSDETSPADNNDVARLASQLPLMRTQLEQLASRLGAISITLTTPGLQPYLTAYAAHDDSEGRKLQADEATAAAAIAQATPQVSSIRRGAQHQLIMTAALPVFAPEYIAQDNKKPVGLMLLITDVTSLVQRMTLDRGLAQFGQQGSLVQVCPQGLERLKAAGTDAPLALPGWKLNDSGDLPLGVHTMPDGTRLYAMGLRAPGLPWIVVQDELYSEVEHRYISERNTLLWFIGAGALAVLLMIGMFWWRFVGQRERAVANEIKQLYQTVNQQHQLLRGINGTMADGIMMLDREGIVQYANDAFAAMAGKRSQEVIGHGLIGSFGRAVAERVVRRMGLVLRDSRQHIFQEDLPLASGTRSYQIACSPFLREDGAVTGTVAVFRDTTDLLAAQLRAQTMVQQTIGVLVGAIEAVDPYLRGQSMHTGSLAASLAQALRLDESHATTVRTAASLSQIGMIQLPRDLVSKKGALTVEERCELHKHVDYARKSLEGIDFGLPVQQAIYEMHEYMDGSGYPRNLKGEAININSRLLAVSNTFCALLRPRSYRSEHTVEGALNILSATPPKYDPAVVQALREFLFTLEGEEFLEDLQRKENA